MRSPGLYVRLNGGGSVSGVAVLKQASSIWDASETAKFTIVNPAALLSTASWSKTNVTFTSGVADPDGGTGAFAVIETATTGQHITAPGATANFGPGWHRARCKVKVANIPTSEWRTAHAGGDSGGWVWMQNATGEATNGTNGCYITTGNGYRVDSFTWRDIGDGWREVIFEGNVANTVAGYVHWFRSLTSRAGINAEAFRFYQPTLEQPRVSAWLATGGATLSQGTNASRPIRAPVWLGNNPAIAEGYTPNMALTSSALALGTQCSIAFVVGTKSPRPTADKTIATLTTAGSGSIAIQIANGGTWKCTHTDDAGNVTVCTTSRKISPFPVHLSVVQAAGFLRIYVDGVRISENVINGQATITGLSLFGATGSDSVIQQIATWPRALGGGEVVAVSGTQRASAGLPAKWKIYYISGQSNATSSISNTGVNANSGTRSILGWANRIIDSAGATLPWVPGFTLRGDYGLTLYGSSTGIIYEMQKQGMLGGVISSARGGTPITWWLEGGAMRAILDAEFAAAPDTLGTHLFEYAGFYWLQGEAEATDPVGSAVYLTNLESLRTYVRSKMGDVPFVIHRLNAGITDITAPYGSLVRAAQDEMAVRYSDVRITRLDGLQHLVDNWHYNAKSLQALARNFVRAMRGLTLLTAYGEDP